MTLKIGSRSPKSNQLVPPSQQCICASLVKILPSVQKITCGNEASRTQTPTGSAPKTICPPLRLGDIIWSNSVHSFSRYGAKTKFLNQSRVVTLLQICKKQRCTILTLILSMMMCIQNLVLFCQFVLKILSKNQILTSIKGRDSVANLQKTLIYNTNIDLVNDNVYTKFGLNLLIPSQDIEQKPNSDVNQGQ